MNLIDRVLFRATRIPGFRSLWVRFPIGPIPTRVRYDIWSRPHYAYGIYSAANLARQLKIPAISVIEFGVAGGHGLLAMEDMSGSIASYTGVRILVFGFDSGRGLPIPQGYRDMPFRWGESFYEMDEVALRSRLTYAQLRLGDLEVEIPTFLRGNPAPIGFISFDLDYYSSTMQAFQIFDSDFTKYLPRVYCYFDDITGFNEYTGELAAIKDFNSGSSDRKVCLIHLLRNLRDNPAPWNDQMYVMHDFSHPLYCTPLYPRDKRRQLPITGGDGWT